MRFKYLIDKNGRFEAWYTEPHFIKPKMRNKNKPVSKEYFAHSLGEIIKNIKEGENISFFRLRRGVIIAT